MLSRQHRPTSRPAGPGAPRPAGPKPARPHQGRSRPAGPGRRRLPGDGDVTTSPSNARKGDVVSRRHRVSRGVLMGESASHIENTYTFYVRHRLPRQYAPGQTTSTAEDIASPNARRRCHGRDIAPQSRPAVVCRQRPAGPRLVRPHPGHSRPAGHSRPRLPGDGDVVTSPSSSRKGDVSAVDIACRGAY